MLPRRLKFGVKSDVRIIYDIYQTNKYSTFLHTLISKVAPFMFFLSGCFPPTIVRKYIARVKRILINLNTSQKMLVIFSYQENRSLMINDCIGKEGICFCTSPGLQGLKRTP